MTTKQITLAVLAMPSKLLGLVDLMIDLSPGDVPSLRALLKACNLEWDDVKLRYGDSAFDWRPFGDSDAIVLDVMERAREFALRDASTMRPHMFRWLPMDLTQRMMTSTAAAAAQVIDNLTRRGPSVIVTDPVSLYCPPIANIFGKLDDYAESPSSVILVLSPIEDPAAESVIESLIGNARAIVKTHFKPPIPALAATGVMCGIVRHPAEVERYLRAGFGALPRGGPGNPLTTSGV